MREIVASFKHEELGDIDIVLQRRAKELIYRILGTTSIPTLDIKPISIEKTNIILELRVSGTKTTKCEYGLLGFNIQNNIALLSYLLFHVKKEDLIIESLERIFDHVRSLGYNVGLSSYLMSNIDLNYVTRLTRRF